MPGTARHNEASGCRQESQLYLLSILLHQKKKQKQHKSKGKEPRRSKKEVSDSDEESDGGVGQMSALQILQRSEHFLFFSLNYSLALCMPFVVLHWLPWLEMPSIYPSIYSISQKCGSPHNLQEHLSCVCVGLFKHGTTKTNKSCVCARQEPMSINGMSALFSLLL